MLEKRHNLRLDVPYLAGFVPLGEGKNAVVINLGFPSKEVKL